MTVAPRTSFNGMMSIAKKKLPTRKKTPRLTLTSFPINNWKKFNVLQHESLFVPASLAQLTFLLYPLLNNVSKKRKVPVDLRFSPGRARWASIINNQQRGNTKSYRPSGETNINKVKKVHAEVLPILKKGKVPMPDLLYGYVPGRDDWMPTGLIDKAALIGLVGQLK